MDNGSDSGHASHVLHQEVLHGDVSTEGLNDPVKRPVRSFADDINSSGTSSERQQSEGTSADRHLIVSFVVVVVVVVVVIGHTIPFDHQYALSRSPLRASGEIDDSTTSSRFVVAVPRATASSV